MTRLRPRPNKEHQQQNLSMRRQLGDDRNQIFLTAPIRNPNHRALSDIYYHRVSLQHQRGGGKRRQPSDPFIIKALQELQGNYISEYTYIGEFSALEEPQRQYHRPKQSAVQMVQSILQSYDFLFLVDEMTKSLIVFAWITGLPVGDLMVASSKQSGSWYAQPKKKKCVQLIPPVHSAAIQNFLESDAKWKRKHAIDRLLYAAVQQSLDKTMEQQQIGGGSRQVLDQLVQEWNQLQSDLETECSNETFWPCSSGGQLQLDLAQQSCYTRDFGCGHACYDRQFLPLSKFSKQMLATVKD
ncbi:hypothetical protein ACA910_021573 [Epithemia clementina (nom. ined.)]